MRQFVQICVLFLILLPTYAHAQEQEDVVKVKSNLVNIDVIVKDKKGKYISESLPGDDRDEGHGDAQVYAAGSAIRNCPLNLVYPVNPVILSNLC